MFTLALASRAFHLSRVTQTPCEDGTLFNSVFFIGQLFLSCLFPIGLWHEYSSSTCARGNVAKPARVFVKGAKEERAPREVHYFSNISVMVKAAARACTPNGVSGFAPRNHQGDGGLRTCTQNVFLAGVCLACGGHIDWIYMWLFTRVSGMFIQVAETVPRVSVPKEDAI